MENKQKIDTKKLSYEDLSNVCAQLEDKCRELAQQNFQLQQSQALIRLDFLFKVLDKKDCFDNSFVADCTTEIKNLMVIKEAPENTPKKKESAVGELSKKLKV